jgi:hypothetical protein
VNAEFHRIVPFSSLSILFGGLTPELSRWPGAAKQRLDGRLE